MDVNAAPIPTVQTINDVPVVLTPPGWEVHELLSLAKKQFVQTPSRIKRTQVTRDNDSFVYYDQRFSTNATLYTVSRAQRTVSAQLDFHETDALPAHDEHKLIRNFTFSKEFLAWKELNKKAFNQIEFAHFLEDRINDVSPDGATSQADLMNAVVQFKANQNSTCQSANNLVNGDVEFLFASSTTVTSGKFPTQLVLRIPMFEFGQVLDINARLKYRLKEGVLTFWYELIRLEEVIDSVFEIEVDTLRRLLNEERSFLLVD